MNRTLFALTAGAALGAAATLYVQSSDRPAAPGTPSRAGTTGGVASGVLAADAPASLPAGAAAAAASTRERSSLYAIAAEAGAARLEELLANTAAQGPSAARDLAIGVFLRRYVEVDAPRALEIARTLVTSTGALAELYGTWAARDADRALDALRAIADPAEARAAAVAMLAALGNGDGAVDKVAAAVSAENARVVRVASIELRAESSPAAALDAALSLESPLRWPALERVAEIWARDDARSALARADEIFDEGQRRAFQFAVLSEWMRLDVDAVVDHLAVMDTALQQQFLFSRGMQQLASGDPRRALATAHRFPDETRSVVEQIALQALAAEDPRAALEYADAAGERGKQLLPLIALGYGRTDPEAALAWARAHDATLTARIPGSNSLMFQVLIGIGSNDPNRAIDVAATLETELERSQGLRWVITSALSTPGARSESVAQHVLSIEDPELRQAAVDTVFETWSGREPRAALDWAFANAAGVQIGTLENVAQNLAQRNPALAVSYTARVPNEARERWVRGVALGYAQTDPAAALDWIAQFRGEPAYDAGVAMIVPALAQRDPSRAAGLIGSLTSAPLYEGAVVSVAHSWAAREPARAAQWTLDLEPGRARDSALTAVAQAWASTDPANARSWALRLPTGTARDAALSGLVSGTGIIDSPDPGLWNAFSDERARERAVVRAIGPIGFRNADEARALMDRYVADPELRRQAEQMLEAAKNGARMGPLGVRQNFIMEAR